MLLMNRSLIALVTAGLLLTNASGSQAQAHFYGPYKLEGNRTAKVVSVSQNGKFWTPDGRPAPPTDMGIAVSDPKVEKLIETYPLVRLTVQEVRDFYGNDCAGGKIVFTTAVGDDKQTEELFCVKPNPGAKEIGLTVGFGTTPYRVYADCKPGAAPLFPEIWSDVHNDPAKSRSLRIKVAIPKSMGKKQLRVAIVLENHRTYYGFSPGSKPLGSPKEENPTIRWFTFPALDPRQVARVQLMAQDIEWVKFTGIRIQRNGGS